MDAISMRKIARRWWLKSTVGNKWIINHLRSSSTPYWLLMPYVRSNERTFTVKSSVFQRERKRGKATKTNSTLDTPEGADRSLTWSMNEARCHSPASAHLPLFYSCKPARHLNISNAATWNRDFVVCWHSWWRCTAPNLAHMQFVCIFACVCMQ